MAFKICFNRNPDDQELRLARSFFHNNPGDQLQLLTTFCQALFASAEFRYED